MLSGYECFDSTISTKSVVLVKHSRLVVSIPQPDCLFSADTSCQQVSYPKPARDVCLVAVLSHPCSCSAYLRVGSVVLQQEVGRKIGWMLFTLFAMLFQFGIILVILRAILVTTIGYVQ